MNGGTTDARATIGAPPLWAAAIWVGIGMGAFLATAAVP